MTKKVAVLCFEESRPWVSSLRQQGYSVPWVEEPKAEVQKQASDILPDVLLVDVTRTPELGEGMVATWAKQGTLEGVPVVLVYGDEGATSGLGDKVEDVSVTTPDNIIAAVKAALAGR